MAANRRACWRQRPKVLPGWRRNRRCTVLGSTPNSRAQSAAPAWRSGWRTMARQMRASRGSAGCGKCSGNTGSWRSSSSSSIISRPSRVSGAQSSGTSAAGSLS
ncbi:hypothetical protein G6F66_015324 [Rhizopus arrhizus]|nr:hypothetical protein G6F66_015324 [Rhizopus arrhizus]